jgi:hypothetical protein
VIDTNSHFKDLSFVCLLIQEPQYQKVLNEGSICGIVRYIQNPECVGNASYFNKEIEMAVMRDCICKSGCPLCVTEADKERILNAARKTLVGTDQDKPIPKPSIVVDNTK